MRLVKVIECAPIWYETATTDQYENAAKYEIRVSVVVDGVTQVLQLTPIETLKALCDRFTYYKFPEYIGFSQTPDSTALAQNFYNWNTRNLKNLERIVLGYLSKYNPIENYNGTMEIVDESESENPFSKTKTISGKVKNSQEIEQFSRSGGVTNDEKTFTDSETEQYETSMDETNTPELKTRNKQNAVGGYGKTSVNPANNYTQWDEYTETETETGGKTHTETRHGNLGVTTSQSMVTDELELRKHDIIMEYLYRYVFENLFMAGD